MEQLIVSKWTQIALQNFGLFSPLTALKISTSGGQTGSPELRLCLRFSSCQWKKHFQNLLQTYLCPST